MSVQVSNLVWRVRGMPAADKIVLLRLADAAHDDGTEARPSLTTVAEDCGCTMRHVRNALRRLEAAEVIVIQRPSTNRTPTVYAVNLDHLKDLSAAPREEPHPPLERNHVPPKAGPREERHSSLERLEGNHIPPREEPRSPLERNHVPPNHPITILEPSKQQQSVTDAARNGANAAAADPPLGAMTDEEVLIQAAEAGLSDAGWPCAGPSKPENLATARAWRDRGATPEIVRTVARLTGEREVAKGHGPPQTLKYLDGPIADALRPPADPAVTPMHGGPRRAATDAGRAHARAIAERLMAGEGGPPHDC